jgi:hypothetical protein
MTWSGDGTPAPVVRELVDAMEQFREAVRRMSGCLAEAVRVMDDGRDTGPGMVPVGGTPCPREDTHDPHVGQDLEGGQLHCPGIPDRRATVLSPGECWIHGPHRGHEWESTTGRVRRCPGQK